MSHPSSVQEPPPADLSEDDGAKLIVLSCVFSVLCIAVVSARFWAATKKKARLWWDDWLCIPSLVGRISLVRPSLALPREVLIVV